MGNVQEQEERGRERREVMNWRFVSGSADHVGLLRLWTGNSWALAAIALVRLLGLLLCQRHI